MADARKVAAGIDKAQDFFYIYSDVETTDSEPEHEHTQGQPPPEVTPELLDALAKQVEFYFSDANLPTDKKLLKMIKKDSQGFVPVKLFGNFRKIRALSKEVEVIASSLKNSKFLELSADMKMVRRVVPIPEYDIVEIQKRIIVVENLPVTPTIELVTEMFAPFGTVRVVRICVKEGKAKLPSWLTTGCSNPNQQHAFVEFDDEKAAAEAASAVFSQDDNRFSLKIQRLITLIQSAQNTPRGDMGSWGGRQGSKGGSLRSSRDPSPTAQSSAHGNRNHGSSHVPHSPAGNRPLARTSAEHAARRSDRPLERRSCDSHGNRGHGSSGGADSSTWTHDTFQEPTARKHPSHGGAPPSTSTAKAGVYLPPGRRSIESSPGHSAPNSPAFVPRAFSRPAGDAYPPLPEGPASLLAANGSSSGREHLPPSSPKPQIPKAPVHPPSPLRALPQSACAPSASPSPLALPLLASPTGSKLSTQAALSAMLADVLAAAENKQKGMDAVRAAGAPESGLHSGALSPTTAAWTSNTGMPHSGAASPSAAAKQQGAPLPELRRGGSAPKYSLDAAFSSIGAGSRDGDGSGSNGSSRTGSRRVSPCSSMLNAAAVAAATVMGGAGSKGSSRVPSPSPSLNNVAVGNPVGQKVANVDSFINMILAGIPAQQAASSAGGSDGGASSTARVSSSEVGSVKLPEMQPAADPCQQIKQVAPAAAAVQAPVQVEAQEPVAAAVQVRTPGVQAEEPDGIPPGRCRELSLCDLGRQLSMVKEGNELEGAKSGYVDSAELAMVAEGLEPKAAASRPINISKPPLANSHHKGSWSAVDSGSDASGPRRDSQMKMMRQRLAMSEGGASPDVVGTETSSDEDEDGKHGGAGEGEGKVKRRRRRNRSRRCSTDAGISATGTGHADAGNGSHGQGARGLGRQRRSSDGYGSHAVGSHAVGSAPTGGSGLAKPGKKPTKKDYSTWAAATPEYRAEAAAKYGAGVGSHVYHASSPVGSPPRITRGSDAGHPSHPHHVLLHSEHHPHAVHTSKGPDGTKGFGMGRGKPLQPPAPA